MLVRLRLSTRFAAGAALLGVELGLRPALLCASPEPALQAAATTAGDLAFARDRIDAARRARDAADLTAARAQAAEAVHSLLARAEAERDAQWDALLVSAANLAWDAHDFTTARVGWEAIADTRARTLPPDHRDRLTARLNVGSVLFSAREHRAARAELEPAIADLARVLPAEHPQVFRARAMLARTLLALNEVEAARALGEELLESGTRVLPHDDPDLQQVRLVLADTLHRQREFARARPLFEQAVEVHERTLPFDHVDAQRARRGLALTLGELGELAEARRIHLELLEIRERTLSPEHPDLRTTRVDLARLCYEIGDLASARSLYERLVDIDSQTLSPDHPDLQAARLDLALTLHDLGDDAAARVLQEDAVEVLSRTLPPDAPDLARARMGLANTLRVQRELLAARALQESALQAFSSTFPPDHDDVRRAKLNLASTLNDLGDLAAARALYEEVLEVSVRTLPPAHPELLMARGSLALTLSRLGDFPAARAVEEEVLADFVRTLPDEHPNLQIARGNLGATIAAHHATRGPDAPEELRDADRKRFRELALSLTRSAARMARAVTLSASSRESEERCAALQADLSICLSYAAGYGVFAPDPALARAVFELSETTRAGALVSSRVARLARSDERCAAARAAIRDAGVDLAKLVRSGATAREYDAAIARRDRAQRDLMELARGQQGAEGLLAEPEVEALRARLSADDAIVAYRRYTLVEHVPGAPPGERVTESLCAFVLRADRELERIELGRMDWIEAAVKEWRDAVGVSRGRGLAAASGAAEGNDESVPGERLRAQVFDPLLPSLGGVRRLVLVLDDVLHAVPIDALPAPRVDSPETDANAARLGDQYAVELRATVQELLDRGASADAPDAGLVVTLGGSDYGARSALADSTPSPWRGSGWEPGFTPLPGTLAEARGVAEIAREKGGERSVVMLEGTNASRAAIEELGPKARVLHLATHGWFAPETVRSWNDSEASARGEDASAEVEGGTSARERVKVASPMVLCGLALAGANAPADADGHAAGLVTAEEIAGWDLSGCELAVLSACDTNVGERRAGQGVASLQKALHIAGARSVITSLWKVPDEATKELMLDFYRRMWIEGKPKARALWEAKQKLRDAKAEGGKPKHATCDWAAWVISGDPR